MIMSFASVEFAYSFVAPSRRTAHAGLITRAESTLSNRISLEQSSAAAGVDPLFASIVKKSANLGRICVSAKLRDHFRIDERPSFA
jgi:hypothetical protein